MKIKAKYKLIPAIAMLLVSAVLLTTASYAWFTMSRTVQATGMELTAIAPTNLLISNAVDGTYAETTAVTENFGTYKLKPASSMEGVAFYAANEIKLANHGAPDADTKFTDVSTTALTTTQDGYYADFKVWLKTEGEDAVPVTISRLATLTSIADKTDETPDDKDITPAVRFAILDGTGAAFTGAGTGTKNVHAFDPDYFGTLTGPIDGPLTAGVPTDTFTGTADANLTDGSVIFTVPGGGTPIAVTIRVWIEGQDLECVTANAAADFTMNVGFSDTGYTEGIA